jgi:hypothetical protein
MHMSTCTSCNFACDASDNFCRRCGIAAAGPGQLPAVREAATPTLWRPQASPVVKGAAVMAVGTVGQFLFRRVVGGLFSGSRPGKRRGIQIKTPRGNDGMVDEAQIITETIMMRRVRIRRQV